MVVRGKKVFLISRLGKCGGSTCGPLGTATRHQHNLELPQQQQRRLSPAGCQQPAASSPAATAPPSKPIQSWAANISGSLIWPEMGEERAACRHWSCSTTVLVAGDRRRRDDYPEILPLLPRQLGGDDRYIINTCPHRIITASQALTHLSTISIFPWYIQWFGSTRPRGYAFIFWSIFCYHTLDRMTLGSDAQL